MRHIELIADGVIAAVRSHVAGVVAGIAQQIDAVSKRVDALPAPTGGTPGEKGDPGERGEKGLDGAAGIDGKLGEQGPIGPAGPGGEKGMDGASGKDGRDGIDGKLGEPGLAGKDGAQGERGTPGEAGAVGAAGPTGPQGEPGPQGQVGADGRQGDPGQQGERGIDGAAGGDGKSVTVDDIRPLFDAAFAGWALDFERRAADVQQRALERMPAPKDGQNGRDGFQLDDLQIELGDDGRTLTFKYVRGETVIERAVLLPIVIDTGVYRGERAYVKGDGATWDGSFWIAQRETQDKPGTSDAWRLSVKKGRDGRDGLPPAAPKAAEPVRVK